MTQLNVSIKEFFQVKLEGEIAQSKIAQNDVSLEKTTLETCQKCLTLFKDLFQSEKKEIFYLCLSSLALSFPLSAFQYVEEIIGFLKSEFVDYPGNEASQVGTVLAFGNIAKMIKSTDLIQFQEIFELLFEKLAKVNQDKIEQNEWIQFSIFMTLGKMAAQLCLIKNSENAERLENQILDKIVKLLSKPLFEEMEDSYECLSSLYGFSFCVPALIEFKKVRTITIMSF